MKKTDGNGFLGRMGLRARINRKTARALNSWCRSLALMGVVLAACGEPSEQAAPTEAVSKVQEAVVDENAPLAPGEVRGARTRALTFWPWNHADPIASSELVPVTEVASGGGRIFNSTAYPAGTYWIAAKHSPNQGEWVTHLIRSKAPPPGGLSDGNSLWLTHSQFIPTGQVGPGGAVASDPPGLVNGEGFVTPGPSGGALSTPVVSGPSSGVNGTLHNWTSGPADSGAAVRVRDDNLVRIPFVTNRIIRQSFLTQASIYVPSHPERAGGAAVGNAVRYLLFLQRGGVNLASGGTTLTVPIDFSNALDQWKSLHVRTDVTTSGGTLEGSSDDWARVKYRIYLDGQLVSTQEPTLDVSVLQGQIGPVTSGPGFAVLRGWQGDAAEAFIDGLENYTIAPPTPLVAGETVGPALWTETFGTPGDGTGASLSASKFIPLNSDPDRSVRLFAAGATQMSGTTAIAYRGSGANPARVTQHHGHYAPGAACSTNATTADCRLPSGGTFDGTAMWVSHSRFVPANGSVGPPAIGSDSPPAVGRRTDGTDAPADVCAYVRPKDEHLIRIPFTDGRSERQSYLISADVYVPSHVGGHEWVRVAPFVRRGTHVEPSESAFEIGLLGLTNRWFRMTVRADVTTHAGGPGTADDKADVIFHYAYDGTSINWAPFGGAYANLDNIAKLGIGDLEFGVSYGVALGWQLDALETFIDNVSVQPIGEGHALCAIDTDCPTGQICADESARVGLPSGTRFCWDMACGTASSSMCGSTSSPCGLCPSGSPCTTNANCESGTSCSGGICACPASCEGKACGASDGCGKTCYCGVGQESCTAATPCETGYVCQAQGCGATPGTGAPRRPGEVRLGEWQTHMGHASADAWDLAPYRFVNHNAFGSGVNVRYSGNSTAGYRIAYKNHVDRGDIISHHFTPSPPPATTLPAHLGWYDRAALWLGHSRFQSGAVPAIGQRSPDQQTGIPWNGGAATYADTGSAFRFHDLKSQRIPIVTNQTTRKSYAVSATIYVPAHPGARYGVRVSPYLERGGAPLTAHGGVSLRSIDFANHTNVWSLLQVRADIWTHGGATDGPADDIARITFHYYLNGQQVGTPETADISAQALGTHTGPLVFSPSFGLRRGWEGDAPEAYFAVVTVNELGQGARLSANESLGAPLYTLTFNETPESSSLTGTGILDHGFHGHLGTSLRLFDGRNTQRGGRYITTYKNSAQAGEWISHHFRTLVPSEDTHLPNGALFDGTAFWLGHSRFLPAGEVVTASPLVTSAGPPAIGLESPPATGTRWNGTVGPAEWGGADARVANDLMDLATVPFTSGVTGKRSYLISMDAFVPKHAGAHALNHLETPPAVMRGGYNYRHSGALNFGALLDRWNHIDVRLDVVTYGTDAVSVSQELGEREVQFFVNGKFVDGHSNRLDDGFLHLAPGQPLKVGPGFALGVGWLGAAPEAFIDNITMRPITSGPTACGSDAPCLESGRVCVGGTCKDPACARPNPPCGVCGPCGAGTPCTSQAGCDPGFACTNGTCECVPQCAGKACGADNGCGGACECGAGTCESDMECGDGFLCGLNNGACFGGLRSARTCWPVQCQDGIDPGECGEPNSPCGSNCACVNPCDADSPTSACAAGEVCRRDLGVVFDSPSRDVCLDTRCPSNDQAFCGGNRSLCGGRCICTPDCSTATCANPGDGCGGTCPGVCSIGDTCANDAACAPGSTCLSSQNGSAYCRLDVCRDQLMQAPLCGGATAPCGECPTCTPQCGARECGPDPACGMSCANPGQLPGENECPTGERCNASGQCVPPTIDTPILVPDGEGGTEPVSDLTPGGTSTAGAVNGTFSVSPRGSAEYRIPIEVPPGRAGLEPQLSLKYTGSRANGDLGVGWELEGLSRITRCPRIHALDGYAAPVRAGTDAFCLDGKRLTAVDDAPYGAHLTEYRTLIDTFVKIESYSDPGDGPQLDALPGVERLVAGLRGPDGFRAWTKDGRILTFGGTVDSMVMDRNGFRYTWLLRRIEDRSENTIIINYKTFAPQLPFGLERKAQAQYLRPSLIAYTGHGVTAGTREVRFNYEERPDKLLKYFQGGVSSMVKQRLSSISTFVHGAPVKTYRLGYSEDRASQISEVTECEQLSTSICKSPTRFEYKSDSGFQFVPSTNEMLAAARLDATGDGIPDYLKTTVSYSEVEESGWLLVAAQILADHLVDTTFEAGYEYGIPATVIWSQVKSSFWGLFADEPKRTVRHDLLVGTGQRSNPITPINNIGSLPCGGGLSALMDHDRDGRDDLAAWCLGVPGEQALRLTRSLGAGDFINVPSSGAPFITVPNASIHDPDPYDGGFLSHLTNHPQPGSLPIMYDIDGDSLHDIISCADVYTLEVRRRVNPLSGFADPIRFETPEPEPSIPPSLVDVRERHPLCRVTRPTYNIFDVDGDGTADLLVRDEDTSTPFAQDSKWKVLRYVPATTGFQVYWQTLNFPDVADSPYGAGLILADLNGDGLMDVWKAKQDEALVWMNTGAGFDLRKLPRPRPALEYSEDYFHRKTLSIDYDSDGRTDILEHWRIRNYGYTRLNYALIPQHDVSAINWLSAEDLKWPTIEGGILPGAFAHTTDVDADGNLDLFGSYGGVFFGSGLHNRLLTRVENGLGHVTSIIYDGDPLAYKGECLSGTWPETCLKKMRGLVTRYAEGYIDSEEVLVTERIYDLTYKNGYVSATGHGFLGFEQTSVRGNGWTTTTDFEPVQRYTTTGYPTLSVAAPYIYPRAGLPRKITVASPRNGATSPEAPLEDALYLRETQVTNDWKVALSEKSLPFPTLEGRTTVTYERRVPAPFEPPIPENEALEELSRCHDDFEVDEYGNVIREENYCTQDPEYRLQDSLIVSTFLPDPDTWLINQLEYRTIERRRNGSSAETLQEWDYVYDGAFLKSVTRAPTGTISQRHRTTYGRDTYGNVESISEAVMSGELPRITTITYDADGVFPQVLTNPEGHVSRFRFDPRWGRPKIVADANGIVTRYAYDGLGSLSHKRGPDGDTVYDYANVITSRDTAVGAIEPRLKVLIERQGWNGTPGGRTIREFDYLGRIVATAELGFGGEYVLTERAYDARGRVTAVTMPHTIVDPLVPVPTESYEYDRLDRVTKVKHSDVDQTFSGETFAERRYASKRSLASTYSAWANGVDCGSAPTGSCALEFELEIDESGKQNLTIRDAHGHVVRSIDGENVGNPVATTNYRYDGFGRLESATDNRGAVTSFNYDAYGRLKTRTDPNSGTTTNTYNGFDEIKTTSDGGRTFTYDNLGRVATAADTAGSYVWTYDQGPNAIGRLSGTQSPATPENPGGQSVAYAYEPPQPGRNRGVLEEVTYTIDGTAYGIGYDYDDLGRVSRIDYPDMGTGSPVAVQHSYDTSSGALVGLDEVGGASTTPIWHATDAFEAHLIKRETFGSGAVTTYTYEADQRWLTGIETKVGPEDVIQTLQYTHHRNGQIDSRTRNGASRVHVYDAVSRLQTTTDNWGNGIPPEVKSYGYDAHGSLTTKGDVSIEHLAARPHLIDTIGANEYLYDVSGNLSERTGPDIPGGHQTITYTSFDLPRTVVTGSGVGETITTFEYTADEERIVRRDPDGTRHFIPSLYQRRLASNGDTLEERFQIGTSGRLIAEIARTPLLSDTIFFHGDNLGSADTLSSISSGYVTQEFDPWGEVVPEWAFEYTRPGFTGHEHDRDLGLIDMKGRVYDPLSARFLTPDPIMQSPFSSQGLNRYSYVFNDPINNLDPTGFLAILPGYPAGAVIVGGLGIPGYGINIGITLATTGYGFPHIPASSSVSDTSGLQASSLSGPAPDGFRLCDLGPCLAQNAGDSSTGTTGAPNSSSDVPAQLSLEEGAEKLDTVLSVTPGGMVKKGAVRAAGHAAGSSWFKRFARWVKELVTSQCFVAGTLVRTQNGLQPIELVEVGQLVWTRDAETGDEDWKPVVEVFRTPGQRVLHLTFEALDGTTQDIRVTREHPFWSLDVGRWSEAGKLEINEEVDTLVGPMRLAGRVEVSDVETVYNFEVADSHTYFVGEMGLWVHNTCPRLAKEAVRKGQGPRGITRIDKPDPRYPHSQWEAHTGGQGSPALLKDGTWKHVPKGEKPPALPRKTLDWLRDHGWEI